MIRLDRFSDSRPERREGLSVGRGERGLFLADEAGHEVCELNESAAAVWQLCDGVTTPAEMVDAVCLACNVDRHHAEDDIGRILTELAAAGLVRWRRADDDADAAEGDASR